MKDDLLKRGKMSNIRSYTQRTLKNLMVLSGGMCELCGMSIIRYGKEQQVYTIAELAHIIGLNNGSPRYNELKSTKYLNSENNIMVLCRNCHSIIDKNPDQYTVNYLIKKKRKHEKQVINNIDSIINRTKLGGNTEFKNLNKLYKYLFEGENENDEKEICEDKREFKYYENMILSLNNLSRAVRNALLDFSVAEPLNINKLLLPQNNNINKKLCVSYIIDAFGREQFSDIINPLINEEFIEPEIIEEDTVSERFVFYDLWVNILKFLDKEKISFSEVIIERNYAVFDEI